MAHFIGEVEGSRGEASRLGTQNSGVRGHLRGWNVGASILGWFNPREQRDEFSVSATHGSNGHGHNVLVVETIYAEDGRLVFEGGLLGKALDALVEVIQTGKVPESGYEALVLANRVQA